MKTNNKRYEAPRVEVIEIDYQGILCVSADTSASAGGGTTNMGINTGFGW